MADKTFKALAIKNGDAEFNGKRYALTSQAQLTNRIFPGWFGDAKEGEQYTSEWSAPAVDEDGEKFVIFWRFDAIRGQEPEDDSDWPWNKVSDAQPA